MTKYSSWTGAALAALTVFALSPAASASSHAEAPGTAADPDIDNADVWAWVQGSNLIVVATYNGLQAPYAAPNWKKFADDALYEIHITRGPTSLDDVLTYQIQFNTTPYPVVDPADLNAAPGGGKEFFGQLSGGGAFKQGYTVTKVENGNSTVVVSNGAVAPPNVGPRTNSIAYKIPSAKTYEQFFVEDDVTTVVKSMGAGQGRVFAGPRDDPFFVDLGAVFDLAGLRTVVGGTARDSVRYTNVNSIVLEIPLTVANGGSAPVATPANGQTVGVWASASRRKVRILRANGGTDSLGPWRQVSRLGLPLINEAVIGLQDKDKWNRMTPKDDLATFGAYFLNPIIVRDAEFADFYATGGPLAGCVGAGGLTELKTNRTDIVDVINLKNIPSTNAHSITSIGDVLRVDLGIPSGFPNGRLLGDDVVDVELGLLLCKLAQTIPDGVAAAEAPNKTTFPFLPTPWESFSSSAYPAPAL